MYYDLCQSKHRYSFIALALTMRILSSADSKSLGILCLRAEVRQGIFASLFKQVCDERWFAKVWMCVRCMEMLSCFYAPVKEVGRCGQKDHCPLCTHTQYTHILIKHTHRCTFNLTHHLGNLAVKVTRHDHALHSEHDLTFVSMGNSKWDWHNVISII